MRASKVIIKGDAQKVMGKCGFGHRFHDLKYFEVGIFLIFLDFVNLRALLKNFLEKNQFYVFLSYFK